MSLRNIRKTKSALRTKGMHVHIVKQLQGDQGQQCGRSRQQHECETLWCKFVQDFK